MKNRLYTLLCLLFVALTTFAYDVQIDSIYYYIDEYDKIATVTYNSESPYTQTEIVIPEKIVYNNKEYDVTSIDYDAFYGCSSLTSVSIPNSVITIGERAFYGCSSLTSITIPENVSSIGGYAFSYCSSLKTVAWNAINPEEIIIEYGSSIVSPFSNSPIESLIIGDRVTYIPKKLCDNCSTLTSVTIGKKVKEIGADAFYGCSALAQTNYTGDIAGWCQIALGSFSSNPTYNSKNLFINGEEVKDVVIPNTVTSISSCAFYNCEKISSLTISENVKSIGYNAFGGCKKLFDIYCYPTTPPEAQENSFTNYNVNLYVPCESLKDYQMDMVFGSFKYIQCLEDTPPSEPQDTTIYHPTVYDVICEGDEYYWMGMQFTEAGRYEVVEIVEEEDYIYHIIYTLELTVIPPEIVVLSEEAYDSYEWHGEVYTESGSYFYEEWCYQEILELTIIPSEDKEYVYGTYYQDLVCNGGIYVDPITGENYIISSLVPTSLTWSDTVKGTEVDTIHTFNITPIVSPEPLTEDMLYAIGSVPRLVAGEKVDIAGTTELIMAYYQMVDQDDIADVIGVEWVAGHDVVLDTEQTTHTMVLEVWDECGYRISKEFTFPVSKKDSEPQDTTICIYYTEDVTICEGETLIWMGMEYTETGTYTCIYKEIVEDEDYTYIYLHLHILYLTVLPYETIEYEVEAYDSFEWHGIVYTESGTYTYQYECTTEVLYLTIIPSEDNQGEVVVEPSTNSVTITWQKEDDADTYIIVIKQGDKVVCTLIFDAEGNLVSVNYLPGRESNKHGIQHAGLTSDSFQYTITGLTPSTDYTYTVTATDDSDNTISSYSGEFTTHHATSVENTNSPSPTIDCQKILYEDHIYILRDGKTYTIMGQEI